MLWFLPLLRAGAIDAELVDPQEKLLTNPEWAAIEINQLLERARDLADAPKTLDCRRFPDPVFAADQMEFNREYRKWLTGQLGWRNWETPEIEGAIKVTDWLWHVWDFARDAARTNYPVTLRRQWLRSLREMVGPEDYAAGILPPAVPVWRFAEVRR